MLFITFFLLTMIAHVTVRSLIQQREIWLSQFEMKIQEIEDRLHGDIEPMSNHPYRSALVLDRSGNVIRADPLALEGINIKSSIVFKRINTLGKYNILILVFPDLHDGKNSIYFVKKSGEEYSVRTYLPESFFPGIPEDVILQIKSGDLVLYSSQANQTGQISSSSLISLQSRRFYIVSDKQLNNSDNLNLVILLDITGSFYSVLLLIPFLIVLIYLFIRSSRRIRKELKTLDEEQSDLTRLIENLSHKSLTETFDLTSRLEGLIDSFRELKDRIGQKTFLFSEHREYLSILSSFIEDIFLLLEKVSMDSYSLKRMESYLSNVINSMPSLIFALDPQWRVTQWNQEAVNRTQILREQALGCPLEQILPRLIPLKDLMEKALSSGEIQSLSHQRHSSEKGICYENITIFPLTANGAQGVVIRIDDVTENVKLQENLMHSQKMDAIGQLAGGIAHDFNNMLGGIIGAMEYIRPYCPTEGDVPEFIDLIFEATKRASDLAKDLLAFSRKKPVSSTSVNIHYVIQSSLAILEKTLDKRITIKSNLQAERCWIIGDDSQLQNIFMNLGINASHAMPDGGELTFASENVDLTQVDCSVRPFDLNPGAYISIYVRDTGTGIPKDLISKVFEPFFTTKEQGKGTGLGLAAVYGTIQRHRGSITLYSEEKVGTSFHILLPLSENMNNESPETDSPILEGQGNILLVDDEKIMLNTGKTLLKEMGYQVTTAANGSEALDIFSREDAEFDLVILDMIMPVMNGKDCFFKLREKNPLIPVIIASGFAREEELDLLKKSGCSGFISKPYRSVELSRIISHTLKNTKRRVE